MCMWCVCVVVCGSVICEVYVCACGVCVVVCGSVVCEVYVCACGVCVWWYVGLWYVRCMYVHVVCACGGMWECGM